MKKVFTLAAMSLMAIAATLSFSSCSNDDDVPSRDTWKNGEVLIKTNLSDDMLNLFDIKIAVTDFNGKTDSITVVTGDKSYSYTTTNKNAVAKVTYKATMKPNVKADGKKYDLTCGCNVIYRVNATSGGSSQMYNVSPTMGSGRFEITLSNDEKVKATKEYFERTGDYTFTLKDGSFIQIN